MLTITELAQQKILEYMKQTESPCLGLRIRADRLGRTTFRYDLTLVLEGDEREDDVVTELEHIKVFMDPLSSQSMEGATIDFVSDATGAGFKIDNPQAKVHWDDPVAQKVQDVLDSRVAPALAQHGGWVELVEVRGDTAVVQLGGGCHGCGMAQITLTEGIQSAIVDAVEEINKVVDATNHETGVNPYYAP
jgi:Iron-sulfur cluster assembly accessory protein